MRFSLFAVDPLFNQILIEQILIFFFALFVIDQGPVVLLVHELPPSIF